MKPERTRALYAGSFDPITRGHLDVVGKALTVFDVLHVAAGSNPVKAGLFETAERIQLIREAIFGDAAASRATGERVEIGSFSNESVVGYAHRIGATHLVRGLRQASDFDDEFRYHGVVSRLDPAIPVVHIICHETFLHVSSSTARELASLGEDVSWLVTPGVERALRARFGR